MMVDRNDSWHEPVLAGEVCDRLITDRCGAYLDLTVGTGGHLEALAGRLEERARLYGLDKDPKAVSMAAQRLEDSLQNVHFECASYSDIAVVVEQCADRVFDGILLDLGLSSLQLDNPDRGFSFQREGPLDMRFDPQSGRPTAADLIRSLSQQELAEIIWTFGQQRHAGRLARIIVRERQREMILTTSQLARFIAEIVPPQDRNKACARVFQAFRIAVNGELELLEQTLPLTVALLKPGGRLAVIAYHSLEDRLVKRYFQQEARDCICPPDLPQCVCGHKAQLSILTRRVVRPQPSEVAFNSRARSARLRVVERIAV